jgi:hypothetical protein
MLASALVADAIIDAIRTGNLAAVRAAVRIPQAMRPLEHDASPNIADIENGWTAVHQAASRGNARTPVDVARSMGHGKLLASMPAAEH